VVGGWAFGAAWTLLLLRLFGGPDPLHRERLGASVIGASKERNMNDRNRTDDSELIDSMDEAPSHGGASGGNLQRNVAAQAEEEHEVGGATGVTRVTGEDKPDGGDAPNLPQRD
jgi:hypothetical protein